MDLIDIKPIYDLYLHIACMLDLSLTRVRLDSTSLISIISEALAWWTRSS